MAFFGDGKYLYVGCKDGVIGLDVTTGKEKERIDAPGWVYGNPLSQPFPLASSADGNRIALVTEESIREGKYQVTVYDVKSNKKLVQHNFKLTPEENGGVWYGMGVKFSPNGKRLAVWAGPGTKVLLCDVEWDAKPRVLDGGLSRPTCVAFSPNNSDLVVGYLDGTALVWNLTDR